MAAPSFGFYAYGWNLRALDRELGTMAELGLRHLTLAASYHAGKFIQPRDPRGRVYFPEDGTVYFRARGERYGKLKPQVARLVDEQDVLKDACDDGRLRCRAWTVLNHNSRLGWAHPDIVVRNAWGDPYPYALCPAHPDVAAYAIALSADLADQHDLESLLLETPGWLTYDHGYHHEFAQLVPDAEATALLGLCFCDSCMAGARGAGIDAPRLREAVRRRIDALLAGEAGEGLDEADLSAFHRWRAGIVTALCAEIRAQVRREVEVHAISTCQRPHANCYLEGHDLGALAAMLDGIELPIYQPSAEAAAADFAWADTAIGDPAKRSVILRPGHPDMTSARQLGATVDAMAAAGVPSISFYNYGLLPAANLGWVAELMADWGDKA